MARLNRNSGILRRLGRGAAQQDGFALPAVIGIATVLLIMVAASLTMTLGGLRKAATDEDWNGALAAAYAAIEEYQSRLASDATYVKYGNPASEFSIATGSSVTLPTDNPAFGVGDAGTWAPVPGASNDASFRYEVDNSGYSNTGVIRIRATGRVNDQTRSIVANLRQKGFIDYLWFTQYETGDPSVFGGTNCDRYYYDSPGRGSDCLDIQFGLYDVLDGPVHSNDRMIICGSEFTGKAVTTSNPSSPRYYKPPGCPSPTIPQGVVTYAPPLDPPPTNSEMKKETRSDLPVEVPNPGCLYTGPTQITFHSNGTMTVISPFTKVTQPSYTAGVSSQSPAMCGSISALQSSSGATVAIPDQNLIYVQNVPAGSDPNAWGSNSWPSGFTCSNRSSASEGWRYGSARYPISNEATPATSTSSAPAYGCRNGDVYIGGTLNGAVTVATENFVYVVDDVVYASGTESILGLVGNNAVWVWNPVRSNGNNLYSEDGGGREIDAAIMSVAHTFMAQNYNRGGLQGTLKVVGAIAQKFRGPVGTSAPTGYNKDYHYDYRLQTIAPPKFLTPVSTTYSITEFANVPAAFTGSGAVIP